MYVVFKSVETIIECTFGVALSLFLSPLPFPDYCQRFFQWRHYSSVPRDNDVHEKDYIRADEVFSFLFI